MFVSANIPPNFERNLDTNRTITVSQMVYSRKARGSKKSPVPDDREATEAFGINGSKTRIRRKYPTNSCQIGLSASSLFKFCNAPLRLVALDLLCFTKSNVVSPTMTARVIPKRARKLLTTDKTDHRNNRSDASIIAFPIWSGLSKPFFIQTPINQSIIDAKKLGKIVCQRCGSENYERSGIRHNKKAGDIQRYICKDCHYRFTFNPAFENAKASARVISAAIDLYFKGMSFRKISEHLQSEGTEINYASVCRWIRKFNKVVQPYVDSFVPSQLSGVYHVNECFCTSETKRTMPI